MVAVKYYRRGIVAIHYGCRETRYSPVMTRKTLEDCVRCPFMAECDAHISQGSHKHREKSDPCNPIIENGENRVEL